MVQLVALSELPLHETGKGKNRLQRLQAIVIAGPTASGKTALAVEVAEILGGPVINADSMQVYDLLPVVTARPTPEEMRRIPHLLFGHVHPSEAYSVARYLDDINPILADLAQQGTTPVIAGGTGLYFKAMLEGLAPVPEIDAGIRRSLRERGLSEPGALYRELETADPQAAATLKPGDSQRIIRALEVVLSTGKPLAWWQNREPRAPALQADACLKIVLLPEREVLRERIAQRFENMMETGALEEIEALLSLGLPKVLPAMRAIGVPQLARHVKGECDLAEAVELAVNATRQYAKRQSTWFRNQFGYQRSGTSSGYANWNFCDTVKTAEALIKVQIKDVVNHKR
jgi:tRNA dimethylallyltransferase